MVDQAEVINADAAAHFTDCQWYADYTILALSLGLVAITLVLFRLGFNRFYSASRRLQADDYSITASMVLHLAGLVLIIVGSQEGVGCDPSAAAINNPQLLSKINYILQILYFIEAALLNITFLCLYTRCFPSQRIRQVLLGTIVVNALAGAVFVLTTAVACLPVSYYWDQDQSHIDVHGRCINWTAFTWATAIAGVVFDVWTLCIPLSQLQKLRLSWCDKVGVTLMIIFGGFATVISLIRLRSIASLGILDHPSSSMWNIAYWSAVETNVGYICACLPCMRLMVRQVHQWVTEDGINANSQLAGLHAIRFESQSDLTERKGSKNRPISVVTLCTLARN